MKWPSSTDEQVQHADAGYARLVQQLGKTLAYVRERASPASTSASPPTTSEACTCGGGSIVGGLFRTRHSPARCNACWVYGHYSQ